MSEFAALTRKPQMTLEELLAANSRVLYENIFSTRHIGRVLDFMLYECREFISASTDAATTEYRIRHAIELAIFNAWSNYRKTEKTKCVEIEFGWDSSRLIFSITCYADTDLSNFTPGVGKPGNETSARIAKMLTQIQSLADGLIVRHEPVSGRLQVLAFVTGKAETKAEAAEYVALNPDEISANRVQPEAQVEPLASNGVDGFLADEQSSSRGSVSAASAEASAALSEAAAAEASATSSATGVDENDITVLSGSADETSDSTSALALVPGGAGAGAGVDDEAIVVSGGSSVNATLDSEVVLVKGGSTAAGEAEEAVVVVKGSGDAVVDALQKVKRLQDQSGAENDLDATLLKAAMNTASADGGDDESDSIKDTEESVSVLLDTVKSEVLPLCPGLNEAQFQEAFRSLAQKIRENYTQTLHHQMRIKNIQSITKMKHYKDQIQALSARIDSLKSEKQELADAIAQVDPKKAEILKIVTNVEAEDGAAKPKEATAADAKDQSDTVFKTIMADYQKAADSGRIAKDSRAFTDNMMKELMKDRATLNQRSREVEAQIKKNEYDVKTKETSFKEQMRLKDEQLRQKEFSLSKTKESLADMLSTLEKNRAALNSGSVDKVELATKINTIERLLSVAKDNNERMQKRIEELQKKWQEEFNTRAQLQEETSKQKRKIEDFQKKIDEFNGGKGENPEVKRAVEARDRAAKQVEELKRHTRELQDKLNQTNNMLKAATNVADNAKRGAVAGATGDAAEMKHKLEHSNKLIKSMKDDLERQRKKFDEIKMEETKLRVEVGRLQSQLKVAGKVLPPAPPKPAQKSSTITKPIPPPPKPGATVAKPGAAPSAIKTVAGGNKLIKPPGKA